MSRCRKRIVPEVGATWPEIMLMNVVFPAPFGPMTQRMSPVPNAKSILSFATRPRKFLVSPWVRSSSAMAVLLACAVEQVVDRPCHAALEGDDDDDEDHAEHELPVFRRDRGEIVR